MAVAGCQRIIHSLRYSTEVNQPPVTRSESIRRHKESGGKALAVLPIHYPKEILTAMNILAVELWGPPGPPRGPDAGSLQT